MKKKLGVIGVILVIYVVTYIPISLFLGAYGGPSIKGIGLKTQWSLYVHRKNPLTRQRQVALEVFYYPLLFLDRRLVHTEHSIGIDVE